MPIIIMFLPSRPEGPDIGYSLRAIGRNPKTEKE
jgi:hypothetical protein